MKKQALLALEAVAKLLCLRKSMILTPVLRASKLARAAQTRPCPNGQARLRGENWRQKGNFMRRMSFAIASLTLILTSCGRNIRTAEDVTPGNAKETCLNWKYGATDIRIQTGKITKELVDRWVAKTKYDMTNGKPRIIVTHIDNRTDMVISNDMIRDIIEHAAVDDGRVTMVVGDSKDEQELDTWLKKVTKDPKYARKSRVDKNEVQAPQFLAKIRIVKAMTEQKRYDIEEYLMTLTLYDLETQEIVDSATDILRKKVQI